MEALKEVDENRPIEHSEIKPKLSVPLIGMLLSKSYLQADIAKYFNVSNQAVSQYIQRHEEELLPFTDFDGILSATIKAKGFKIISSIDDRDIKKASLQQKVISGATLIDKYRLIDGQVTEITANFDVAADLNTLIEQIKSSK